MANQQQLDKHFVAASLIIGACYTIFIVIVQHFVGKEASGVAAVSLSALTVAILQKFENLRFKRSRPYQDSILQVPSIHVGTTLFIALFFLGGSQIMVYFDHNLWRMIENFGWYPLSSFVIGFLPFLIASPIIAWSRYNPPILTVGIGALTSLVFRYILNFFNRGFYYIEDVYFIIRHELPFWFFYSLGSATIYYFVLRFKRLRDIESKEKQE